MSCTRVLLVLVGLGGVLLAAVASPRPAYAAAPPAEAFADPAFGWRSISSHDLHAALGRRPWARVVVALRPADRPLGDGISPDRVAAVSGRVLRSLWPADFRLSERWSEIPAFAGLVSRTGLAKLTANPDIARVDLDVGGRADGAQSVPLIRADTAHARGFLGAGATVAVLDSGVDSSHPDLAGRVVDQHCFCTNPNGAGCCRGHTSEAGGDGSAVDDNGHGTNVAGIVASAGTSVPIGVAPAAKVVAVKVLAADGSFTNTSQVISGLNWVMANHPEVRVVNMSLGTMALFAGSCDSATAYTLAFASAISTFRSRGGLVFVSPGNSAAKSAMAAPACVEGAVAVGAVYDSDIGGLAFPSANCTDAATAADQVACFSNSSPALDLLAPGAMITSAGLGGGLSTYGGTSQACPHAAGAAAVLFGAAPTLSPTTIESALTSTGTGVIDPASGRATPRIDIAAALEAIAAEPPPLPPPTELGRPPAIEVAPTRLDFPRVRMRGSAVRVLTIRNLGDQALRVNAPHRLRPPFSFATHPGALIVPRGGWVELRLLFRPMGAKRFAETLVISSDDAKHPEVGVRLSGLGSR